MNAQKLSEELNKRKPRQQLLYLTQQVPMCDYYHGWDIWRNKIIKYAEVIDLLKNKTLPEIQKYIGKSVYRTGLNPIVDILCKRPDLHKGDLIEFINKNDLSMYILADYVDAKFEKWLTSINKSTAIKYLNKVNQYWVIATILNRPMFDKGETLTLAQKVYKQKPSRYDEPIALSIVLSSGKMNPSEAIKAITEEIANPLLREKIIEEENFVNFIKNWKN